MRESDIQSNVLDYLISFPYCVSDNVSGIARQSGRADINACYKGVCLRLEVKGGTEGYGATQQQQLNLKRWRLAGAQTAVIESVKDARQIIKLIDEGRADEIQ